jgi:ATP-dependent Zn protease
VNQAAISAARKNQDFVQQSDLEAAWEDVQLGKLQNDIFFVMVNRKRISCLSLLIK